VETILQIDEKTNTYVVRREDKEEKPIEEKNESKEKETTTNADVLAENQKKVIPPIPPFSQNFVENGDYIIVQLRQASNSSEDGNEDKWVTFPHGRNTVMEYQRCCDYFVRISCRDKAETWV
jgi:hypothetical protein